MDDNKLIQLFKDMLRDELEPINKKLDSVEKDVNEIKVGLNVILN